MSSKSQHKFIDSGKIFLKNHTDLKSYLNEVSERIEKETLRKIPEGEPKEYLSVLMKMSAYKLMNLTKNFELSTFNITYNFLKTIHDILCLVAKFLTR